MNTTHGFIAEEGSLTFYNEKALINITMEVVYLDDDNEEQPFGFDGYVSAYARIYDARQEQLLKNFTTQITRSSNILYFNCSVSDMTFQDLGKYFIEIGYNRNGYETPLRYGLVTIV